MAELTAILLALGILFAVVTLVGHGLWVLLAMLFGSRSRRAMPKSQPAPPVGRRACPRCLTPLDASRPECSVCGWPAPETIGGPAKRTDSQAALVAAGEQLKRFAGLGVLDEATYSRLAAVIHGEQQQLAERKSALSKAAAETLADLPDQPVRSEQAPQTAAGPAAANTPAAETRPPPVAPVHVSIEERARKYAASRAATVEAQAQRDIAGERLAPTAPSVPASRLLAAFLEEKNIRWGELVGGLLIVGSSIALVISFLSEIAARPLLKFVLFNGVTAALFAVGLYTDRRWKIHTTSHGLLLIAMLLVPLNFLAIAAFTQESPPSDLLSLAGEAASLAIFSVLVFLAGKVLVPRDAALLVVGVMVPSLMQLLVRRFADSAMPLAGLYGLAAVPIASYVATSLLVSRWRLAAAAVEPGRGAGEDATAWPHVAAPLDPSHPRADGTPSAASTEADAQRALAFLGLVSAATLLPLALLAYKVSPLGSALHRLAPLITIYGLPALVVGLLFRRRLVGRQAAALQTAGIGVGVLGALVMVAAVALAWPEPAFLLPTALATALAMVVVAALFEIPAAHLPAGMALAAAWLVGFYVARGDIEWTLHEGDSMRRLLLSAMSGHVLLPLAAAFGSVAWWLSRTTRRADAFMIAILATATAGVSLALVVWFGFARVGDPANATWTLAIYALAALGAARVLDRSDTAWAGTTLLLAALVQAFVYRYGMVWELQRPWVTALLAHASLAASAGVVFQGVAGTLRVPSAATTAGEVAELSSGVATTAARRRPARLLQVLEWSALATSLAAAALLGAIAWATPPATLAVHLAWLAAVWLLFSELLAQPALFRPSQVAILLAIACSVTGAVHSRPWYMAARRPWLDPWFLEAQGIALAGYCLVTDAIWHRVGRRAAVRATWPAISDIVRVGLVMLVGLVALYAVVPGVGQELCPLKTARGARAAVRIVPPIEEFQIAGIPNSHAADRGAWILLGAIATVLAAASWRTAKPWRRTGLLLVAAAVVPLLAALWQLDVAVASALRWFSAAFFVLASIAIWLHREWSTARGVSTTVDESPPISMSFGALSLNPPAARDLLATLVILVYVAMGTYVAQAALMQASAPASFAWMWPYVWLWAFVLAVVALLGPQLAGTSVSFRRGDWGERVVLPVLAALPLAILLTFSVAQALDQHPLVGPEPASWFRRIGWDISYGVPLAAIALAMVGHAIRDRSSRFAFAAGGLCNVVATIVTILRLARGAGTLDAAAWITLGQVNSIVAGLVALTWLAVIQWHWRHGSVRPAGRSSSDPMPGMANGLSVHSALQRRGTNVWPQLLTAQVALCAALCGMFLLPAIVQLAVHPVAFTWSVAADGVLGWSAAALATAAAVWLRWQRGVRQAGVGVFLAAIVALTATSAARWDTGNWLAYHALLAGSCLAAWLLPLIVRGMNRVLDASNVVDLSLLWSAPAARCFAAIGVLLAVAGYDGDPASPWWTLAALVAIGLRSLWIAWYEARGGFVWVAAPLLIAASSILWLDWADQFSSTRGIGQAAELLWFDLITLAAIAIVSVLVERRILRLRPQLPFDPNSASALRRPVSTIPFHRFAAWAIAGALLLTTGAGLFADLEGRPVDAAMPLAWIAWAAAVAVALACWWDPAIRWPVACLYCIGLIAVGLYLDGLNFRAPMFHWALALALAAYSLATSGLWSARERLFAMTARWGAPRAQTSGHGWLVSANLLLGVVVLLLVVWIEVMVPELPRRMVAAQALGAQAFAIGLLARGIVRTALQYLALVWGVLFAVAFAWAWVPPDFPVPWLHRLIVTVAGLAAAVIVYGFGLVKLLRRESEWTRAAARLVLPLTLLAVALMLVVLGVEVIQYANDGAVPVVPAASAAVAVALAGLAVAALLAALVPGRDPLGLSERGRTAYVYAAEALGALLFVHIRVTMPWLFSGWFQRFWPLMVMGIAFIGVGLGELFERQRRRVLSEPLHNTGALLPLLPAIGFWFVTSQVHYSLLLLSIGVLYAATSALRRSSLYGILAAIAANGSLWCWLYSRQQLGFFAHPQLWLIPPALAALIAGYINRERLTAQQLATLRYAAAIVIYVSSTADVFINGVDDAPWLPAVLAALSILGVFAGIVLRVRAFLYLGMAFLVVALLTVIWHAAIHQQRTWILWVAGIVTGGLIIALFGLFEKRRDDVLRMVEKMKQWEA